MTGLTTRHHGNLGAAHGSGRQYESAGQRCCEMRTFEDIVTLPSNVHAVETAQLFAAGTSPFVALVGPSGCGKTHLIEAATHALHALEPGCWPHVISAKEWTQPMAGGKMLAPWLIDNVQAGIGQHKTRLQMRLALERRVRAGRPTLVAITADRPTRALSAFLPNQNAWVIATIAAPTQPERMQLISKMAERHGLALSESLQVILAQNLQGDGRTLEGACKRLRLAGCQWMDPVESLKALGLLAPMFSGNSTWDLRDAILEIAEGCNQSEVCRDLAMYVMLKIALLPEANVATFFEVEPCAVYGRTLAFEKRLESNEVLRKRTRWFVEEVVDRLRSG